jgi:hypothetical protein
MAKDIFDIPDEGTQGSLKQMVHDLNKPKAESTFLKDSVHRENDGTINIVETIPPTQEHVTTKITDAGVVNNFLSQGDYLTAEPTIKYKNNTSAFSQTLQKEVIIENEDPELSQLDFEESVNLKTDSLEFVRTYQNGPPHTFNIVVPFPNKDGEEVFSQIQLPKLGGAFLSTNGTDDDRPLNGIYRVANGVELLVPENNSSFYIGKTTRTYLQISDSEDSLQVIPGGGSNESPGLVGAGNFDLVNNPLAYAQQRYVRPKSLNVLIQNNNNIVLGGGYYNPTIILNVVGNTVNMPIVFFEPSYDGQICIIKLLNDCKGIQVSNPTNGLDYYKLEKAGDFVKLQYRQGTFDLIGSYFKNQHSFLEIETFTGRYWIDGKKIYRKVFEVPYQVTTSELVFDYNATLENIDIMVSMQAMVMDPKFTYQGEGNKGNNPNYGQHGFKTYFDKGATNQNLAVFTDFPIGTEIQGGHLIIEYTKN